MSKRASLFQDIATVVVALLVVLLVCFMFPDFFSTVEIPELDTGFHKSSAQANLLNLYTAAEQQENSGVHNYAESTGEWYVATDPYDSLGNARSVVNFLMYEWEGARQWLVDNYKEDWPHGPVKDSYEPVSVGAVAAIAIVANAFRESSCTAPTFQGTDQFDVHSVSAEEVCDLTISLGDVGGKAYGIIQWDGGRRTNFMRWCKSAGMDPRTLESQMYYMAYEYYASSEHPNYQAVFDAGNGEITRQSCDEVAELFRAKVERGGTPGTAEDILATWGNKWKSAWGVKPEGGLYQFLYDYING